MKRKTWIDALRALAMILVVFGHQIGGVTEFFVFTGPVKMPLFFAISGYLFNMRESKSYYFFRNWFIKLIIPWFCLVLIPFLPKLFIGANIVEFFEKVISGKRYWFMPCFVIAEVIHFYVRKWAKKDPLIIVVCILLTFGGIYLHSIGRMNFAMFNRSLSVQFFFLIGYLFHKYENKLVRLPWIVIGSGGGIYLILTFFSLYLFPKASIDVHLCRYYNYPYCFSLIILGLLVLFTAAAKSNFSNKILSLIGQNTLVIYLYHNHVIGLLVKMISFFKINVIIFWIGAFVKTVWGIVVCNLLAHYINRFVPEFVGKKRKTHT